MGGLEAWDFVLSEVVGKRERAREASFAPALPDARPSRPSRARVLALAAAAGVLALVLLAPAAAATVTVEDVLLPERTMAGKTFPVSLTLRNDGATPRSVYLFAALYDKDAAGGPCGASASPRFRTFTHLVQEAVNVPARGSVAYPDADDEWLQLYGSEDVDAEPQVEELCIFVANASSTQAIQYESFESLDLSVRGVNAAPTASFTWDPEVPGATRDVRFSAEGSDLDGDPVAFSWDFGYVGASGRARASGATATTFFFPPGEYVVTLTASDGLEDTQVARTIGVVEAGSEPTPATASTGGGGREIPASAAVAIASLAVARLMRRR